MLRKDHLTSKGGGVMVFFLKTYFDPQVDEQNIGQADDKK